MSFAEKLQKCPLIAILRGITPAEIEPVCEVLYESGFRMLEIPLNSPDALESIRRAANRWHEGEKMLIGAGTVLSAADVERVAAAGGRFIISPDTNEAVIRATKRAGLVSMPGFFTASEGFAALRAGADYLKLFPAGALGPGYIKDLKAVISRPILAVGGVNRENLADFLAVCAGAGIGGALYRPGRTPDELRNIAAEFIRIARPQP